MQHFRLIPLLLLVACGAPHVQIAVTPPQPIRRCLLLTTNDSESNFDGAERGADGKLTYTYPLARIAAAKKAALAARPGGVLLLEGGDVLQGRFLERQDGDRAKAAADNWPLYEAAGYDFGVLGNHEFDNGPKVVRRALQGLHQFRLLAANVDGAGTALDPADPGHPQGLFAATALVECGGIKIGLFGLLTPSTRTISDLGDVKLKPLQETTQASLTALRQQGAETIVLLSHLGVDDDKQLAQAIPGIDVIVGGHSHTKLEHAVRVEHNNRLAPTWITQTGARFERLGRMDLAVDADGHVLDATTYALELPQAHVPDPGIVAATDKLLAELVPEKVIGKRDYAWDVMDIAHSQYAVRASRAVAQYAARVSKHHVDGGLLNTGGFRSHTIYPPGPVTNLEVSAIHPFRNRVVLVTLTGQQLKDVLEHACGHAQNLEHGANSIVWGVQVRCDVARTPARYKYVDNKPVAIEAHGDRAQDVTVAGQPLALGKKYTIATLDYLARGGSSYLPLQLGEHQCLDGKAFKADDKTACGETALLSDVISEAVTAGELDRP